MSDDSDGQLGPPLKKLCTTPTQHHNADSTKMSDLRKRGKRSRSGRRRTKKTTRSRIEIDRDQSEFRKGQMELGQKAADEWDLLVMDRLQWENIENTDGHTLTLSLSLSHTHTRARTHMHMHTWCTFHTHTPTHLFCSLSLTHTHTHHR